MLDELGWRIARRDFDGERIVQQALCQRADLVRERRRKEQVLSLLRQHREYAADVADEAHVEHAVGFVEHEVTDLREIHRALVDVVEQAAGGGDDDVDALAQRVQLRARAHAAEDEDRALVKVTTEILEGLAHLRGELARWHEHEQTGCPRATWIGLLGVEPLQQRQREGRGLAGAGLGSREQVATVVNRRNGRGLDGGGHGVPDFLHGTQEGGRKAELFKGHEITIALLPRLREPVEASLIQ